MEPEPKSNLRFSNSNPSLRPPKSRPKSIRSTGSRSVLRRHGLLRSDTSTDHSAKDLPVPPVLTAGPPEPTGRNMIMKHRLSSLSDPTKKPSEPDIMDQSQDILRIGESRRPEPVCLDPTIHPPGTHAKVHHPGLVAGADFCDAGLPTERDSPITTPPSIPSPVDQPKPTMTGRTYRLLKGGDLREEVVDVSDHMHGNHGSSVKVRPAVGLPYREELIHGGHSGVSKVQPSSEDTNDRAIIHHGESPILEVSGLEKPHISEHTHHGHSLTPKVRPSVDYTSLRRSTHNTYPNDIHEGHISVQKAQSYSNPPSATSQTEEDSFPKVRVAVKQQADQGKQDEEPSDASAYWRFPPRLREKRDEEVEPGGHSTIHTNLGETRGSSSKSRDISVAMSRAENRHSLSASQYSASQKSFDVTSKAVTKPSEPNANQENVRHDSERVSSLGKPSTTTDTQGGNILRDNGVEREGSAPLISPTSHLRPEKTSETFDARQPADPKLTKLPEKIHPRENAADRLLSEALVLADEVTEQDHCGHDENPSTRLQSTSEVSHQRQSSKPPKSPHDLILTGTAPDVYAFPPKPTEQCGILKPDVHSGNIKGPPYSITGLGSRGLRKATRKFAASREMCHHVSDDDCVLPMPPPGNKLRRDDPTGVIKTHTKDVPNSREPPITPRQSSRNLRAASQDADGQLCQIGIFRKVRREDVDVCSLDGGTSDDMIDFSTQYSPSERQGNQPPRVKGSTRSRNHNISTAKTGTSQKRAPSKRLHELRNISLRRRSHVSIRDGQRFSLTKSVKRQPTIARDWSPMRKRFVASVACISTALIGVLVGIYAGLVPSIQYYIADFHHYSIIGNVGMYLGMALSTFFCWPLPLLHGRKPYILCSLCIAMPLLFPQAVAVSIPRSPLTSAWRWALLLPRAIMGCALGFANMNFHSILTDLFGASLMSSNPHQEVVDPCDARRHGGGLGVWLGVWTWCFIGSLGIGFLVGALVIDTLKPSWGLYISIMLIAVVLLLNVLCPEVRRSAWRRSVAEVWTGSVVSRRVARGEIMMHRVKDGPKWWGQEMYHGVALSLEMLRQPGFVIMAVYSAWIYAQVVLIIVLLGSLSSRHYHLRSPFVGAAVSSVAIGALAAVPFQKANIFSRSRSTGPMTNSMTFDKKLTWTSHLVRRAIFVIVLPIAGIMYTIVSSGPPIHLVFPCIFAAIIGFLSCLAIAECNGMLMEAWDSSDLQPGMTGRSKSGKDSTKRTNYSSFPRVTAGWNIIHCIGFIFAAGATGIGGIATRNLGQRAATGVVASILFIHSLLLLAVFARFRHVQIIPHSKSIEMDRWTEERRDSLRRRASAIAAAKANGLKDRPCILGNPSEKFRRMNILELGSLTRWSEIRKKNSLIDEGAHLNRQAVGMARGEIGRRGNEFMDDFGEIVRKVSKRSIRSKRSHDSDQRDTPRIELEDVGPVGPSGAGLDHQHTSLPPEIYFERECVMGQTVPEEGEEGSSMDSEYDDDGGWDHVQHHSSHMTSKVQPYAGFQKQDVRGGKLSTGDYVVDMDASRSEHASHTEPKVKPAETAPKNVGGEHGSHAHESKVKPADVGFEDVDLGEKSSRRDSKTLKQD
ncbi:hypothetical protein GGR54DRAFT_654739 [Hypoxylon sp. NC1633]|nr:hypothetical protein GGR54DRAFT_654739 [Hypoxylon sp. NC1633]